MVTLCINSCTIKKHIFAYCLFTSFIWLLQETEIIFQYEIKLLVFTTQRKSVHCIVQTESWIVI